MSVCEQMGLVIRCICLSYLFLVVFCFLFRCSWKCLFKVLVCFTFNLLLLLLFLSRPQAQCSGAVTSCLYQGIDLYALRLYNRELESKEKPGDVHTDLL